MAAQAGDLAAPPPSAMSTKELPTQLIDLPSELIAIVLSFLGHVRWLRATLATSKLLRGPSLDVMSKRARRLEPFLELSKAQRGQVETFAYNSDPGGPSMGTPHNDVSYRPCKLFRNKVGALIAYVKKDNGKFPFERAWHQGYDVSSVAAHTCALKRWQPPEHCEPIFSFEGRSDRQSHGYANPSTVWYNCRRPMFSFVLPANNYMYAATSANAEQVGRINLETGDVALQEIENFHVGGAKRIEVSPDGKRVAVVHNYNRCDDRGVCLTSSIIQVFRGEEDGTLVYVDKTAVSGVISQLSFLPNNDADEFLCWCRTADPPPGVGVTFGVKLIELGQRGWKSVTSGGPREVGAAGLPDGRIVGCANGWPKAAPMQIVVYGRRASASVGVDERTEHFDCYAHDFYPEAVFGADWWPANAECATIVPLDAAHVVFELAIGNTFLADGGLTLVDVALQQRLQTISVPSHFFMAELRHHVRCQEIFVRPDGRLLVRACAGFQGGVVFCVDTGIVHGAAP